MEQDTEEIQRLWQQLALQQDRYQNLQQELVFHCLHKFPFPIPQQLNVKSNLNAENCTMIC